MKPISALEFYMTSVSLRSGMIRRIQAMRRLLSRRGVRFSESRLYEELLRLYLRHWRGNGVKPASLRRYNADGQSYRIRPLYINRILHAAATQRALHTGESLSRMLDVAIRIYARRFLESVLSSHARVLPEIRARWALLYQRRRQRDSFFISYMCLTRENQGSTLVWASESHFVPKKGLSVQQILAMTRDAA